MDAQGQPHPAGGRHRPARPEESAARRAGHLPAGRVLQGGRVCVRGTGQTGDAHSPLYRGEEDRRPYAGAALPERPAGGRHYERRRRHRRERVRERARHPLDPQGGAGEAALSGGPGRRLHVHGELRGDERQRGGAGRQDLPEPQKQRGGHAASAGSGSGRGAAAGHLRLQSGNCGRQDLYGSQGEPAVAAKPGFCHQPAAFGSRDGGRGLGCDRGYRQHALGAELWHRRRGRKGGRSGAEAGAGLHQQGAPLGRRLQVPARAKRDRGGGYPGAGGPHRPDDPASPLKARPRGGDHRFPRHSQQSGLYRREGRAHRRYDHHPEGRRHHPGGAGGGQRESSRRHRSL